MKYIFLICLLFGGTIAIDASIMPDSRIIAHMITRFRHQNIVFSPYAIRAALMLNSLGVQSKTANEVREALHYNDSLNLVVKELENMLAGVHSPGLTVRVGSRVFMPKGIKSNPRLSLLGDDLEYVDFTDSLATRDHVSQWLSAAAGYGRIRMQKPFASESTGELVNTLLFRARWQANISHSEYGAECFKGTFLFSDQINGSPANVVLLPFDSADLVMLLVAHSSANGPSDFIELEHSFRHNNLTALHKQLKPTHLRVMLPDFVWSSRVDLETLYQALHIEEASEELGISHASHFAQILIDRHGINFELKESAVAAARSNVPPKSFHAIARSNKRHKSSHAIARSNKAPHRSADKVHTLHYYHSFFFAIMDAHNIYLAGHKRINSPFKDYYDGEVAA